MKDQLEALLSVAVDTLGTEDSARIWLNTPCGSLSGQLPIELASQSEDGFKEVLATLGRIRHGIFS